MTPSLRLRPRQKSFRILQHHLPAGTDLSAQKSNQSSLAYEQLKISSSALQYRQFDGICVSGPITNSSMDASVLPRELSREVPFSKNSSDG